MYNLICVFVYARLRSVRTRGVVIFQIVTFLYLTVDCWEAPRVCRQEDNTGRREGNIGRFENNLERRGNFLNNPVLDLVP